MYAWGDDYHRVVKDKLFAMVERIRTELGEPFDYRVCVDTAPWSAMMPGSTPRHVVLSLSL